MERRVCRVEKTNWHFCLCIVLTNRDESLGLSSIRKQHTCSTRFSLRYVVVLFGCQSPLQHFRLSKASSDLRLVTPFPSCFYPATASSKFTRSYWRAVFIMGLINFNNGSTYVCYPRHGSPILFVMADIRFAPSHNRSWCGRVLLQPWTDAAFTGGLLRNLSNLTDTRNRKPRSCAIFPFR